MQISGVGDPGIALGSRIGFGTWNCDYKYMYSFCMIMGRWYHQAEWAFAHGMAGRCAACVTTLTLYIILGYEILYLERRIIFCIM